MRINDSHYNGREGVSGAESSRLEPSAAASAGNARVSGDRDSVTLSDLAALVTRLAATADDSRTDHIARIASSYRAGTYGVNDLALAGALIDRAFES
jgi:hypothetical protein